MKELSEQTLVVSLPKAFSMSILSMATFIVACFFVGLPLTDPLLIGFLVVLMAFMTIAFTICFAIMPRTKIGYEGLRQSVPWLYQRVLRWQDITSVQTTFFLSGPFYIVRGKEFGDFCLLPRQFILKDSSTLKQAIESYAPANNIIRKELPL